MKHESTALNSPSTTHIAGIQHPRGTFHLQNLPEVPRSTRVPELRHVGESARCPSQLSSAGQMLGNLSLRSQSFFVYFRFSPLCLSLLCLSPSPPSSAISLSLSLSRSLSPCLYLSLSLSLSHSHTLAHSLTHSLSLSPSLFLFLFLFLARMFLGGLMLKV